MADILLWTAGYAASCVSAFWLMQRDWRRKFDFTTADMWFFGILAATGPFGLTVAITKTIFVWLASKAGPKRVIWPRRG